ncbi:Protein misato 1 [Chionoecetes opilio]|uniref:Protein misato 1 n=1 Tax=Chionoecetes opilio TaxID=41210 RepID=A0A8J4Y3Y7_CHIOP|nr:Protein misato 1 [Chionoecetes opilio]
MSQTTRELITLQVGHHANFIGTHWWNLQEASFIYSTTASTDINHDFLFREGITSQRQETYTPRLLAIDLKGSLHSLPAGGSLYTDVRSDPSTSEAAWDGQVELIHQLSQEKNEFLRDLEQEDAKFRGPADEDKDICIDDTKPSESEATSSKRIYDLTKSVKVWSDYLCPHLHPKTIYLLDNLKVNVGRASANASEHVWGFSSGYSAFHREEIEEEITDRIRCLAESCNSLQGFQILSDIHDGMGGIGCGILEHLADEYTSKDSITFATSPPHLIPTTGPARMLMQASIIQSYTEMYQLSSMLIPLNMRKSALDFEAPYCTYPHLALKDHNAYTTSSIMAAFLDTISLAYRSRSSPLPFTSVVDLLTPAGRKVAGGSLSLPLGIKSSQSFVDWLHQQDSYPVSVSAGCTHINEPISELLTIRGIPASGLNRSDTKLPRKRFSTNAAQLYYEFLQAARKPPSQRLVAGVEDPLKLHAPFPNIFAPSVTDDGYIDKHPNTSAAAVRSVPCMAGLHQSQGVADLLQQLLTSAKKFDVMKVPSLLEEGADKDSWAATTEGLQDILNNYGANNESLNSDDD